MKQQFSTPRTSDKEGSDPRGRENKREAPTSSYLEGAFRPLIRSGNLGGAPWSPWGCSWEAKVVAVHRAECHWGESGAERETDREERKSKSRPWISAEEPASLLSTREHICISQRIRNNRIHVERYTIDPWTTQIWTAFMLSCFSHVWLFTTIWTVACQAPLSMGFSRQEYCSGLPCLPPGVELPGSTYTQIFDCAGSLHQRSTIHKKMCI